MAVYIYYSKLQEDELRRVEQGLIKLGYILRERTEDWQATTFILPDIVADCVQMHDTMAQINFPKKSDLECGRDSLNPTRDQATIDAIVENTRATHWNSDYFKDATLQHPLDEFQYLNFKVQYSGLPK